jgi:hypothetical protein
MRAALAAAAVTSVMVIIRTIRDLPDIASQKDSNPVLSPYRKNPRPTQVTNGAIRAFERILRAWPQKLTGT